METKMAMINHYKQNKEEFICDFGLEDEYAYDEWIEDYIMTSELK